MSNHANRVKWSRYVWGAWVQPKHSFCSWLVFCGSLLTEDKLIQRGITDSSKCHLCEQHRENTKHLFFECSFSKQVFTGVKVLLSITSDTRNANWEWKILFAQCCRGGVVVEILKVYISATVYHLWAERNTRKHSGKKTAARIILEKVLKETKFYLQHSYQ
ncbi:RNA-directed DNA polymerase (reverse transcriptase)-related family protein [Thalictrum thalictroides]|uniref:RNA-directed DNA polymerase (Reverse transcriptase)-related family protein n=1 Tax=Thalictrum thalictroides TaxID=46969 RepID=A0A7J6XAW8_THATH|nr:RNA-directed DNA polymerase (reverse transcriptase)-related family protein [Thalictrum thalictroides]